MKDWFAVTRPRSLLQAEGVLELVAACIAYGHLYPGKWVLFALLFLVPDVSLLGYLSGKNSSPGKPAAAAFYNVLHSYILPLLLGFAAWRYDSVWSGEIALIWLAHIGFDRMLGYGLKFPGSFKHTHIQSAESM